MEWYLALILLLGTVCVAMFIGMPVAFAFFATNILGTYLFVGGSVGLEEMPKEFQASVTKFILTPIALFLLMGEILLHTGVAFKAIGAIDRLIARVPGRLAVVTIAGGTIFSSLSGSSIANTAILGSVLLPDMVKRGYALTFAMGPIMAVGGIAVLIPPSALAVLLASLADQSIAKLLIAGIVPGLIMALLFFAYVIARSMADPSLAPGYELDLSHLEQPVTFELHWRGRSRYRRVYDGPSKQALNRWLPFTIYITPLFMIFVVVVGSIFMKLAAPTEAAALGCVAAFALCYMFRLFGTVIRISGVEGAEFSWREIWKALMETAKVNTLILFIIAGSLVFTQALESSGATQGLLREIIAFRDDPADRHVSDDAGAVVHGRVHGPGLDGAIDPAVLRAARHGARDRRHLPDGPDADRDGDQPVDPALRAAALRHEGRGAVRRHAGPSDPRGRTVHRDQVDRADAVDHF